MICVSDRVENILGKGENAGNQHFYYVEVMFWTRSNKHLTFNCDLNLGLI